VGFFGGEGRHLFPTTLYTFREGREGIALLGVLEYWVISIIIYILEVVLWKRKGRNGCGFLEKVQQASGTWFYTGTLLAGEKAALSTQQLAVRLN